MNRLVAFHSPLAPAMDEFVAGKRMQGYDYTAQTRTLSYFDRFLAADRSQDAADRLTLETLQHYVASTGHLAARSRHTRIASLREFSRWLQARCPGSAILPLDILPRRRERERFFPISPEQVAALSCGQAYGDFRRLCRHCGVWGQPPPRLHDLRHNYACRRLALWRQAGMDINALLPILATAMGHVNFFATQRYLHLDAVALRDAAALFHTHARNHQEPLP